MFKGEGITLIYRSAIEYPEAAPLAEKERFELSQRLLALHPKQGRLFDLLSTSPYGWGGRIWTYVATVKVSSATITLHPSI